MRILFDPIGVELAVNIFKITLDVVGIILQYKTIQIEKRKKLKEKLHI